MTATLYVEAMPADEPAADDAAGSWSVTCDAHAAEWHRDVTTASLALTIADEHGNAVHAGAYLVEFTT